MPPKGRGLSFRVAGTPVTIDWTFPVVMIVFGFAAGLGWADTGIWLAMVLISVLWHEMGHALALGAFGRRSRIVVHSVFGLTVSEGGPEMDDRQSIIVSLAGPLAGAGLGLAILAVNTQEIAATGSTWAFILSRMVWINLGYGLLNLLPILPLDGGHVLQRLVHMISPPHTETVPYYVTIAMSAPLALLAFRAGQPFLGIFTAFFAVSAIRSLGDHSSQQRRIEQERQVNEALALLGSPHPQGAIERLDGLAREPLPDHLGDRVKLALAWALLWRGAPGDDYRIDELLAQVSARQPVSLLAGGVAWRRRRDPQAYALLARGFAFEPTEPPGWFVPLLVMDETEIHHLADWMDQMDLADRHTGLGRLAIELERAGRPADAVRVRARLTRPVGPVGPR